MNTGKIIHPTMQRIYEATGLDQSALAFAINKSPQAVNNWDMRGISKNGLTLILEKFNINSDWVLTGNGDKSLAQQPLMFCICLVLMVISE